MLNGEGPITGGDLDVSPVEMVCDMLHQLVTLIQFHRVREGEADEGFKETRLNLMDQEGNASGWEQRAE